MRQFLFRTLDPWLLACSVAITGLSLMVIASSTRTIVPGHPLYYVDHQIMWLVVGLVAMVVVMGFPYHSFRRLGPFLYAFGIVMLLVVLVHGHSALGATRWIKVGPLHFQPSELAKILVVIGLTDLLERRRETLGTWSGLVVPFLYVLVPTALVIKQPDLGTALVFLGIFAVMLYVAGVPGRRLLIIFGSGLALVVALILAHLKLHVSVPLVHSYQIQRLLVFINPGYDPLGAGYNITQSQIVFSTGGFFGSGFVGNQTLLTFLPEHYTDFIFSVVGLELGFWGALGLLLLYLIMIYRGLLIASTARDFAGNLLASGMVALLLIHVVMNAGMVMGIMPVVGVPLPLMSYGGSSMLTDFLALGFLFNVKRFGLPLSFAS